MVRRKNDGGTAVADPTDIAARIAAADAEARRTDIVCDIEQFRRVVNEIADGHEPDGKSLAAIGDLARRLRLPPDAVTRAVAAVQDERRLQAQVDATKARLADVKSREVELGDEIKAVEKRLRELNAEVGEYHAISRGYPYQVQAVNAVKSEHPLLYGNVEHLVQRLIKADAGMSAAVFKPAANYPHVEGASRASWGE